MQVVLNPNSWLNISNLLEFQGIIFWDQTEYPDIPFSSDDQYIQLTTDNYTRIDLIANDYLGDSQLLWILLLANNVDLPNQFIEGQTIRIPAKGTVDQLLNSANANYL